MSVKITASEAQDIAGVIDLMNALSTAIVETNATVVYLDMKVDIEGEGAKNLGRILFDMNNEEFVFFPSD